MLQEGEVLVWKVGNVSYSKEVNTVFTGNVTNPNIPLCYLVKLV